MNDIKYNPSLECPQCGKPTFAIVSVKGYEDRLCPECMKFIFNNMDNGLTYLEALVELYEFLKKGDENNST